MQLRNRDTVTVSPPTFDRTAFARTMGRVTRPAHALFDGLADGAVRGDRFRLLKRPAKGWLMFPARAALHGRPIRGAENALVIHDLRVGGGPFGTGRVARFGP